MVRSFPGGDRLHRSVLICTCLLLATAFGHPPLPKNINPGAITAGRRFRAVLRAQADQSLERQPARSRLDLSDRRRQQVLLQPARGRRRDVCARQEQLDRRAGCRHGQGDLDLLARARHYRHHQPRHQLLGEQGPLGPAPALRGNHFLRAIDARTGKPIPYVRQRRQRRSEGRAGPRSEDASRWCNPSRPGASSRIC